MLQRYGIHGAKTVLENDFGVFLADKDSELKLSLFPIIDPKVIEQMFAGQLKEIQFISQEIPTDIANTIKTGRTETQGTLKVVLTAKRNQYFGGGIVDYLRPLYQDGQCIEIHNVKYREARLVVSLEGKKRTICLTDVDKMRSMPLDVTKEIEFNGNNHADAGHPTLSSISRQAEEIVPSFKKLLGW